MAFQINICDSFVASKSGFNGHDDMLQNASWNVSMLGNQNYVSFHPI